jgi:uncharacterized protein (DUF697 family)/GTP-binding protein EngB required for normal cell division
MQIDTDKLAQDCLNAINTKIRNLKTLNIMVIGKSGVGKSTLINSLFRGNLAETGLGRPVTSEIRKIVKTNYPLAIYDTPGFELSSNQQVKVKNEIISIIKKGHSSKDVNEHIHCIWYCINVGGNRTFDSSELKWLQEFTESNKVTQVPIIIVLTQSVPKSKAIEMKNLVEKENLGIAKVIPILAQDMDFDNDYIAKAYGLDNLIDIMIEVLPVELQHTLQNVQKASLEAKVKSSHTVVATAVASSFGAGFTPIPFADAAIIIPVQISMIAGITVIFGIDMSKGFITSFVSSTIGSAGAMVLGKNLVASLLKLIPGLGSVGGGLISGTVAGIITTALGEAYIEIMKMIYTGEIKKEDLFTEDGQKIMSKIFKEELKKDRM